MRTLIFVLVMVSSTTWASGFRSSEALTARARFEQGIQQITTRYIQDLQSALQFATRRADLAEVAAIQAEISRLSPASEAPVSAVQRQPVTRAESGGIRRNETDRFRLPIRANITSPSRHGNLEPSALINNTISGSSREKWCMRHGGRDVIWQIQFEEPIAISRYVLTSANDRPERDPRLWSLQGSNDGRSWVELDTQQRSDSFPARHRPIEFSFSNITEFHYYRFVFSRPPADMFQVGEINFPEILIPEFSVDSRPGRR